MSTSTLELAGTPSAEPSSPWIPPELISLILVELWEMPHKSQDRLTLLKNVALVNRTWLTLIAYIASRDVHLSGYRKATAFIKLLSKRSPMFMPSDLFSIEINRVANEACRSLTLHVNDNFILGETLQDTRSAVSTVLFDISLLRHLPNLRHISILHTSWTYDDIFRILQSSGFPPWVTHLSLDYSFTSPADDSSFNHHSALEWLYLGRHSRRRRRHTLVPTLRHLSLSGVPTAFVLIMLFHVFTNLDTLELAHPAELVDLAPLPSSIRTLVLRYPGARLSKAKMAAWVLPQTLELGLFVGGADLKPPRIVVRAGTPDPESFIALSRTCKGFNVDLVYERDDVVSPS